MNQVGDLGVGVHLSIYRLPKSFRRGQQLPVWFGRIHQQLHKYLTITGAEDQDLAIWRRSRKSIDPAVHSWFLSASHNHPFPARFTLEAPSGLEPEPQV
jgi:hypothetical protein